MSSIVFYDPNNPVVPNVITEILLGVNPQTLPNSVLDPDWSLVGGVPIGSVVDQCTINLQLNQVTPFTPNQQSKWNLFQGAASQVPFGIKTIQWQGVITGFPQTIARGIVNGVGFSYFCSGTSSYQNLIKSGYYSDSNMKISLMNGSLFVVNLTSVPREFYINAVYS